MPSNETKCGRCLGAGCLHYGGEDVGVACDDCGGSGYSQSPASEEMPGLVFDAQTSTRMPRWVRDRLDVARDTEYRRMYRVLDHHAAINWQADEIARLTRELSESRARAVQGEQDAKTLAYWIRGDTRATPAAVKATLARHEAVIGGPCEARTSTPTPDTGRNDSDE